MVDVHWLTTSGHATNRVAFFPDWADDSYLTGLAFALRSEGWSVDLVDRKGLTHALVGAIAGRNFVHLHWYEALPVRRIRSDGIRSWFLLPMLWLAGRRGRLIWTVHNVRPHEGCPPLMGVPFLKLLARSASRILVHFDHTRELVAKKFGARGKVFVTPPASFGDSHGAAIPRAEARAKLFGSSADDSIVFVQIGNLRAYKDPATTIRAFREVAPPSALLFVAGKCRSSEIRSQILEAAAEDPRVIVRFDFLSDADIVAALCAADWSICPYRAIDNPGAVNLSVGYGCPIIAPAFPSVVELTADHPAILYSTEGPRREHLSAAIAQAARMESVALSTSRLNDSTRREQARQTAAHYLAALERGKTKLRKLHPRKSQQRAHFA
jgi:beta-1,4-mannosyltransferase